MSRNTRFLCYYCGLKYSSVQFFRLFSHLAEIDNFDRGYLYQSDYPQSAVQHHGERLCVRGLQRQTESCSEERERQADLLGESNFLQHKRDIGPFSFAGIRVRSAKSWSDQHIGMRRREKRHMCNKFPTDAEPKS